MEVWSGTRVENVTETETSLPLNTQMEQGNGTRMEKRKHLQHLASRPCGPSGLLWKAKIPELE